MELRSAAAPAAVYVLPTTAFHAGVVTSQIGNALACRTETGHVHRMGWLSNPILLVGIGLEALLIVATIYIAPLDRLFNHQPLPPVFWLGLITFAPILYGLEWLRKLLARRKF